MGTHRLKPPSQSGFGLLESLVAVAILSGGMLLLLNAYNRSQTLTRDHLHATRAVNLIQDISERMHINRLASTNPVSAHYLTSWTDSHASAPSCTTVPCQSADWALADLKAWKSRVALLPNGQAAIARTANSDDMLAVMVAWSTPGQSAAEPALAIATGIAGLVCPTGSHCQFSHVLP